MSELTHVFFIAFHRARRTSPMCTNSWFNPLHFDLALCPFIESLWEKATAKMRPSTVCQRVFCKLPQLKGKVPGSKRLLVARGKCELSAWAPPLNTFFLAALAGKAVALNDRRLAVSLLLEFYCVLRYCSKFARWFSPSWNGTPAASLYCTKPILGSVPPPVKQCSFSMHTWCACWQLSTATWHQRNSSWVVLPLHFGPSLHDSCTKMDSQSAAGNLTDSQLDRTMVRGRWASAKTARLCIDDAVSMQAQLVVTCQQIALWRMGCMGPLQLGRLRRPSSGREARSRGHSPRASGARQKSAGGEACVHQDCSPQVRSTEG